MCSAIDEHGNSVFISRSRCLALGDSSPRGAFASERTKNALLQEQERSTRKAENDKKRKQKNIIPLPGLEPGSLGRAEYPNQLDYNEIVDTYKNIIFLDS
jgi:hypothetical protein